MKLVTLMAIFMILIAPVLCRAGSVYDGQDRFGSSRRGLVAPGVIRPARELKETENRSDQPSVHSEYVFDVRDFGAKFDKQSDDASAINRAIDAAFRSGGGIVLLPPGEAVASSIFMKSGVWLLGMGEQATYIRCKETCLTADSNAQLTGIRISSLNFRPANGAGTNSTAIRFAALAKSLISDILIEGFVNGTAFSIGGGVPKEIQNTNLGGNVVWNSFRDISVFGCNICFVLQGKYGTDAPVPPDAPSPIPNGQVVTANKFDNINLYYVGGIGWDLRLAVDTNIWVGGLIELQGQRSAAIMLGDDPNFSGNTYVNSNKFLGIAFTRDSSVQPEYQVLFGSKNFTFGNEASSVDADIDTGANGLHVIDMPNAVNYRICGRQFDVRPTSRSGFRLGCLEKGLAWQDQQVATDMKDDFEVKASPNVNKLILSGSGILKTGLVRLPCRPPDGLRFTVATTNLSIAVQHVKGCEEKDHVAGQGGRITPDAPQSYRYYSSGSYWIRD